MEAHDLILLSPYRFPGQHAMTLADEDMACWLNGYTALWHPALLWQAKGPPRCEAQYDHEQPRSGCVYAVPEAPPLYLPDDWRERVQAAGSIAFTVTPERAATLENLRGALAAAEAVKLGWREGLPLSEEEVGPFFGLGVGYLLQATLAEAMEHDNLLESAGFWDDVQQAVAAKAGLPYTAASEPAHNPETAPYSDPYDGYPAQEFSDPGAERLEPSSFEEFAPPDQPIEIPTEPSPPLGAEPAEPAATADSVPGDARAHLRRAAEKLLSAREVLYPVTIHLLDLHLIDDRHLGDPWPLALTLGNPINLQASAEVLQSLAAEQPEKFALLRERLATEQAEVCGGLFREREDPLMPLESQLWNLRRGLGLSRELLGSDVKVFARKRFGYFPLLPLLLSSNGLTRALFLTFDENSGLPSFTSPTISWTSPDGKQVDAFVRAPYPVDKPQTFFNLGHYWYKTTREDHTAVLALVHHGKPPAVWYGDLMHLAQLAPVLGRWETFAQFFGEVMAGEHSPAIGPDEFHFDYLSERTEAKLPDPVSSFARNLVTRRRLDSTITLTALYRSLAGKADTLNLAAELRRLEDIFETTGSVPADLDDLENRVAAALAERLQARAQPNQPGYMVLNPCSFTRRLALEIEGGRTLLPVGGPVKASQLDGTLLRVVVEVPPLGFAWIPREGPPGTTNPARLRLADAASLTLRNEFFEIEVDRQTGGLKSIRDHKNPINRIAQRLVFNPGSAMEAKEVKVTSAGPALGEIVAEGSLYGEQNQVLANFRQRFRVWLARPVLDIRIEIEPVQPPAGYPWHAYYGARFAWRDERAVLLRSSTGTGYVTTHVRPQTPDYLELRLARQGTVIFPGGLPFHQRQEGGRMLDVILIPEGEKARTFEMTIALDREQPAQTALGLATPPILVPTEKGPPHIGASGWLFHLDTPNLLLTRLLPGTVERIAEPSSEPADAITARLLECGGDSGLAQFRCVRDPKRAVILDAQGGFLLEAGVSGDAVNLEVTPNDMVQVQIEF